MVQLLKSDAIKKELKQLVDTNRIIVQGQASKTEYAINEIISNYRRFEFIYVVKDNEIAGIFFKLKVRAGHANLFHL